LCSQKVRHHTEPRKRDRARNLDKKEEAGMLVSACGSV